MLIKTDYSGNRASIFECDRCKTQMDMSKESRFNIKLEKSLIGESKNDHLRTYHLCKRCTIMLIKGIEKGVKKRDTLC